VRVQQETDFQPYSTRKRIDSRNEKPERQAKKCNRKEEQIVEEVYQY